MMNTINSKTLGEAWLKSIQLILSQGQDFHDDDVNLKEIRNLYLTIENIDEDDEIIKSYANKDRIELMKKKYFTCGLVGDYKIDYGSYIFNNNGVNQFDWLCKKLRDKPETKSATIVLHRPGEDKLTCLSMLDFKLRDNKLYLSAVYRSQNIFSSQPGNMIALHNLHKLLADNLKVELGNTELIIMSAHIYEYDYKNANDIVEKIKF